MDDLRIFTSVRLDFGKFEICTKMKKYVCKYRMRKYEKNKIQNVIVTFRTQVPVGLIAQFYDKINYSKMMKIIDNHINK